MKELKELNDFLAEILRTVVFNQFEEEGITTKKLETAVSMPRPTFYKYFRVAKEQGLVNSATNENHQIIWSVSKKGEDLLMEYEQKVVTPLTREIDKNGAEFLVKELSKRNLAGKWLNWADFSKKENLTKEEDIKLHSMLHSILLHTIFGIVSDINVPIEIQFKIDKKALEDLVRKKGLIIKEEIKRKK